MNKILFLQIGLFITITVAIGNNNTALFNQANDAFKKGQYDSSIAIYEKILKSGIESPELYFNLGNSFFKKKDIASAILNYERAHRLAPEDDDIAFNLQLAQTLVVDKINVLPEFFLKRWFRSFSELYSSNTWAWVSVILFIAFLISLTAYLFANRLWFKKTSFGIAMVFLIFSIVSFITSYSIKYDNLNRSGSIVMTPSVTIKSSPDEAGTDLFVIHEGTKVWVIDSVGEWKKIRIADGNNGWLRKADIEGI
jgi:tetratricopeptide (TPR) repeat protein